MICGLMRTFHIYFLKRFTSNCKAKCDSVEKRRSYRLLNIFLTLGRYYILPHLVHLLPLIDAAKALQLLLQLEPRRACETPTRYYLIFCHQSVMSRLLRRGETAVDGLSVRGVARNLIWGYKLHDIEFVLGQGDKTTT